MKTQATRTTWFRQNFQIIDEKTGKPVAEVFNSSAGDLIAATPELLKLANGFIGAIDDRLSILEEVKRGSDDEDYVKDIDVQIAHWTAYLKEVQAVIAKAGNGSL